jgi:hypothetical protein
VMVRYGGWPAFGAIAEPLAACKRRCRDFQNVCLRRRTSVKCFGMSVKGQNRTHALQQRASYSIASSARTRNDSGILRPRALAVVRLMMKSNLVGCSTGRSAGFVRHAQDIVPAFEALKGRSVDYSIR